VLLSSHLLHEIEVIADEIIVIGRGRIVAEGTKAELLQSAGTFVRARDGARLQKALAAAGISAMADRDGGLRTEAGSEEVGEAAAAGGVALVELRPAQGGGLEQMFLELTSDTQRETRSTEGALA
jgi:ABC-2 type transport system ATP-binding protein